MRILAIECLSKIEVDRSDKLFSESSYSNVAEIVINRLFLYFDDPYIKMRSVLLGKNETLLLTVLIFDDNDYD